MSTVEATPKVDTRPGHLDLPYEDGTFVTNSREHPQSMLLTEAILPILRRIHPDGYFAIGQEMGIYWKETDPPLRGVKSPDWYYVPGVPPTLDGEYRRSYVLWKEKVRPSVLLKFASDDGSEERDAAPRSGKFWVYEHEIRPEFYGILTVATGEFEAYHHIDGRFAKAAPNGRGRYRIPGMDVELGIWEGHFVNEVAPWLRWYDIFGNLIPIEAERADEEARRADEEARRAEDASRRADEEARRAEDEMRRAEVESRRAEDEARRAEALRQRADILAAKLRSLGIDPDSIAGSA